MKERQEIVTCSYNYLDLFKDNEFSGLIITNCEHEAGLLTNAGEHLLFCPSMIDEETTYVWVFGILVDKPDQSHYPK